MNDCKLLLMWYNSLPLINYLYFNLISSLTHIIFVKLMLMFCFKFFAVAEQFKMHQQREED
jgi:hypothetical protein